MGGNVVQRKCEGGHGADLEEHCQPSKGRSKAEPRKVCFGIRLGQLLGCLVSRRGIEENLEKIQAIIDMKPPKLIKDTQHLVGGITSLNHFITRSAGKSMQFLQILRGADPFRWMDQ